MDLLDNLIYQNRKKFYLDYLIDYVVIERTKSKQPTMAISNCLFSPTLKIPAEFPAWCLLAKPACRQAG